MSALESLILTSGEAPLLDSLDFSLPPSSTAVVDRRQHVKAYPTSASSLTPTATRTFRIRLGGDDFIDPSSIRLQYTVRNLDGTNALARLTGPWGLWSLVYRNRLILASHHLQRLQVLCAFEKRELLFQRCLFVLNKKIS